MNSKWLVALLVVVVIGFGAVLWHQQQTIDRLASAGAVVPAAGVQSALPTETAELKTTPALSNVDFTVSVGDAPSRGSATTPVVLMEFSDFQCPFCARYVRDTLPRLMQEYVDSGKVRYVFRQFPLEGLHPNAMGAALVASCGAKRGKFWELHDQLFAHQSALDMPSLMTAASELGLSDPAFKSCVENKEPAADIQRTREEAVGVGFTGTPGFLVGIVGADGRLHATRRLYGANPYSLFQSAIDDVLAQKQ